MFPRSTATSLPKRFWRGCRKDSSSNYKSHNNKVLCLQAILELSEGVFVVEFNVAFVGKEDGL